MQLQIRHKLFLVLLVANVLLAAALFVGMSWNFSRSFQTYLAQTNAKRMAPLLQGLADEYRDHGQSWAWLTHHHREWGRVLHQHLGEAAGAPPPPPRRPPPPRNSPPDHGWPPEPPPMHADGPPPGAPPSFANDYLLLRDAGQRLIMGRPDDVRPEVIWLPVMSNGRRIAELGLTRQLRLSHELDELFIDRLLEQSAWIVGVIVLLAGLLALPFARRLVQPVTRLELAMHRLAGGDIEHSPPLPITGHDELAKLAASFNLLATTLRHNLQARRQWVADIAHELRTPVALLRGELEALLDGVRPLNPAAVQSLHSEILRLSRLINDLHELSLADLGALSYRRKPLSLNLLITELLDEAHPELINARLQLEFTPGSTEFTVFADGDRLLQLFRNLLSNTLRYTQSGGILRVGIEAYGTEAVTVHWEDSAPGVQNAELPHLFERLYRTDSARNRAHGGSGLGLAIAQAIVEAHQGQIHADHSELGGLAVHITLPLHREP